MLTGPLLRAEEAIVLDPGKAGKVFEGIEAFSAGASLRLPVFKYTSSRLIGK